MRVPEDFRDLLISLVILGAAAVAVVLWVCIEKRRKRKRTEVLENLAMRYRMQFEAEAQPSFLTSFYGLNLLTLGHSREPGNVMQGEMDGVTVSLFDYTYVTGSGKSSQKHRQTVVCLSLPTLALPHFVLRPENVFHKIGGVFGFHDIDFPEAPNFSKRFLLRGAEEHAVRAVFNPGVLSFFERHKDMSAEGFGNQLIYYRASRIQQPIDIRGFMRQGCELARLLAG